MHFSMISRPINVHLFVSFASFCFSAHSPCINGLHASLYIPSLRPMKAIAGEWSFIIPINIDALCRRLPEG
jgi:hypothetical protein